MLWHEKSPPLPETCNALTSLFHNSFLHNKKAEDTHANHRWDSRRAILPPVQPDAWWAMRTEETLSAVRERLALATEAATGAQLSAAIAHEIVQPLSALVANARAALHWLEGDPKDIARAASLIEIVLRDGMAIGNVVHEMRKRFKAQSLNRTTVQPNELIRQVVLVVGRDLLGKGFELSVDLTHIFRR